jgi:hypothetical protein
MNRRVPQKIRAQLIGPAAPNITGQARGEGWPVRMIKRDAAVCSGIARASSRRCERYHNTVSFGALWNPCGLATFDAGGECLAYRDMGEFGRGGLPGIRRRSDA